MKQLYRAVALLSLVATIGPALLYLAGKLDLPLVKNIMLGATVTWFVFAALWIYGTDGEEPDIPPADHSPIVP
jgi:hypothetical protein